MKITSGSRPSYTEEGIIRSASGRPVRRHYRSWNPANQTRGPEDYFHPEGVFSGEKTK